jgi:hypothetical protein
MVTLRCTRKLLARLPKSLAHDDAKSTGRLGSWYGTLLVTRPIQLVLLVNETARLPVLLPAREFATLTRRVPNAVAEILRELNVDPDVIERERTAMQEVVVAPTNNRSVLGTMNDFIVQLEWIRESKPHLSLIEFSLALAETPVSPLRYEHPAAVARRLLEA